jgi:hypothetical protein
MARKLENTPAPFAGMSAESAALIHKMMAPEPNARIQSYAEVIARIDQLLNKGFRLIKSKQRRISIQWGQVATAAGVALALAIGIMMSRGPRADANNPPVARYASTGEIESLFDGASLDHWASSGVWAVAKDDEGVSTLSGTGTIRRVFTTLDNYQVTIGLDIHDASAAEIQFAIPAEQRNGRRCVLRISREIGGLFGTRDGDRGPFNSISEPVAFPPTNWFEGRRPYLEVRLERAGGAWIAWFHGERVGQIADDGSAKSPEVQVTAFNGRIRIDSVVLERLIPRPD